MEYRKLGRSGLKVSEISLGGWVTFGNQVTDTDLTRDIILKAFESGINFFDQADVYATGKSEEMMGAVLKELPRHRLVISSKVYWPMSEDVNDRGLSRKHILESIDRSLKRLQTDYLDIYFAHRYDVETPIEETVMAFDQVVRSGRALYWGTSEWTAAQIAEAVAFAKANGLHAPVVEQPQYSLMYRDRVEKEILPYTDPHGLGLVVWSPLGMGMLTGKYDNGIPEGTRMAQNEGFAKRFVTDENVEKVKQLKTIADELGLTRSELALAWVLRQKGVSSAIIGATKVSHVEDNIRAAGVKLSDDVLARIEAIFPGKESVY
ncbi:aldo/keto reductase family protein [Deinococcus cellulosilyticus]|uniref:Voltage-gated potassium channel n=1 Tax=Deinococcus cellulosilyticus (strain DSM 18568 / NBRC 106333 / KACC 11606 / 5516J-15) TaxID=1223518 RepID=A0A511NB92_DEIC1|nr:aldo/keto reductase family protein [Deinococcus cellulosilyticus]GEM50072.1 voltage-gated potassium channel [Deinococcus cellulosilyticus NBRC 106333 = KACC 11606]